MKRPTVLRDDRWTALGERSFDLLVIGGGITGCGIARAAALRGLGVALLEKDDFASGTSSRSSRLVHGGVRYLEHGHLHLVFESSAERRRLLRLAPHLVRPLEFTWPVYRGARIPRWKLGAALTLYDVLALFRNVRRHQRLSRDGVLGREPTLRQEGLLGGATYFDASTSDALEAGAVALNHVAATEIVRDAGRVTGVTATDALTGRSTRVRASVVVRAVGPWTAEIRGSKGAHIAVPRERVGNRNALTLISPTDGRVLFALPAGEQAMIGTTDTYTSASPDEVRASNDDVRYLLDAANTFFPRAALTARDVVSAWAGIRPLVPSAGETPGSASREHAVSTDDAGLVTITGGKLTTYRVMANDVLSAVARRVPLGEGADLTRTLALPGGDFSSLADLSTDAQRTIGDAALAAWLAGRYGTRWSSVWEEIGKPGGAEPVSECTREPMGELTYAVRYELASTLGDLLMRRTQIAFETRDHGAAAAERVAEVVAPILGWDRDHRRRALDEYAREVERTFAVSA